MGDIIIQRPLPTAEAVSALDADLRAALGERFYGLSGKTGGKDAANHTIILHLSDKATAEDDNTARQIVLAHDFTKRTPEQLARVAKKQARVDARSKAKGDKATKDDVIEWLMLEIEDLRELLGE